MHATLRLSLACLLVTLAGCTLRPPAPAGQPPAQGPTATPPRVTPAPAPTPRVTRMKTHPRYAPPPGAACYWDNTLGVYVLEGRGELYYRERTYYRWDGGWSWSNGADGPWQPTDASGVPAGLGRRHP